MSLGGRSVPADVAAKVISAARASYGRILAYLAHKFGDIAAAEDALAEALAAALKTWPVTGVPDSPDAWLMTAARRNVLQALRYARVAHDPAAMILLVDENTPARTGKLKPLTAIESPSACTPDSLSGRTSKARLTDYRERALDGRSTNISAPRLLPHPPTISIAHR